MVAPILTSFTKNMKRLQLLIVLLLGSLTVAQASIWRCYTPASNSLIPIDGAYSTMVNVVSDSTGVEASYVLGTISMVEDELFPGAMQLSMEGFGQPYEPGVPWVPLRADTYCLSGDAENFRVEILSSESVDFPLTVAPSRRMLLEQEESASSASDVVPMERCEFHTPDSLVKILQVWKRGGDVMVSVLVRPVQYDSNLQMLRVCKEFSYRLSYDKAPATAAVDVNLEGKVHPDTRNCINLSYLVIGLSEYQEVASEFVNWKKKSGYNVVEQFAESWTPASVKATIDSIYNAPKGLDYVLILGDHSAVPGQQFNQYFASIGNVSYVSDFGYSCIDEDDIPDIYIGRIPGKTIADVGASLDKIVSVEKNPATADEFYQSCLLNGYFQVDGIEKERTSRRFVETCEDIRDYLSQFGVNGIRNYYADGGTNPKYWSYTYGTGGEILKELQRPTFEWQGNASVLNNTINDGCNLVVTRTHGSVTGWSAPKYGVVDMAGLKRLYSSRYPIIFSLSCNTGNFASSQQGFCQTLMSKPLSGCVAAIGATQASFSILNDAYAHGIVSHLWPEPGLFKPLTNEPVPNMGLVSKYGPTLGETLENANLRMEELAPLQASHRLYQKRLYHIFGDPSMWVNTSKPSVIGVSAGFYYDGTPESAAFKLSVGDEKCIISIVDATGYQYTYYDTDVELKRAEAPLDITVTGHNRIPAMMTYNKTDLSSSLPSSAPYLIDKVVVKDAYADALVYTIPNGVMKDSAKKQSYGLMVLSSNGTLMYVCAIDINADFHTLPVARWKKSDGAMTYIVALTCNGSVIDAKTFIVKY